MTTGVLLYHRVAKGGGDPLRLSVTPDRFEEHLAYLGERYLPISLAEAVDALRRRKAVEGAVVVTFDDAYAGVLHYALPLLERHAVPATVYVPSALVGSPREFWWEELEAVLLQGRRLPARLMLDIAGAQFAWDADRDSTSWLRIRSRRARARLTGEERLYYDLVGALQRMRPLEQRRLVDTVIEWAGGPAAPRHDRMPVDAVELRRLAESSLIEIGAHSVSHARLGMLSLAEVWEEIAGSRSDLEVALGRAPNSFAYPYGSAEEIGGEAVAAVQKAGFAYACTTREGLLRAGTDVFRLPRFVIGNWDLDEFARRIDGWMGRSNARTRTERS